MRIIAIIIFYGYYLVYGNNDNRSNLSVNTINNQTFITLDPQIHIDYGLAYPLTYELSIPSNNDNLKVYRKFISRETWTMVEEKTSNDFFNGIEAVRFDYEQNIAYVSIGFSEISDSINIDTLMGWSKSEVKDFTLGKSVQYSMNTSTKLKN